MGVVKCEGFDPGPAHGVIECQETATYRYSTGAGTGDPFYDLVNVCPRHLKGIDSPTNVVPLIPVPARDTEGKVDDAS